MLPGYRNGHKARKVIALGKHKKGDCAENRANRADARKGTAQLGRPRIPILLGLVIALALLAGLAPAARASSSARPPALSSTRARPVSSRADGPGPEGGVIGNAPYCNRDYERLAGDQYIAYNDDLGDYTCLQTTDQQNATGFQVTTFQQDVTKRVGAFPNIFAGFEWGRHPYHDVERDGCDAPAESVLQGSHQAGLAITVLVPDQYRLRIRDARRGPGGPCRQQLLGAGRAIGRR
jgi:hypothetical protein